MTQIVANKTDRINFDEDTYIDIKHKMSVGDYDRVDYLSTHGEYGVIVATLLVNIKGGKLRDENDNIVDVTEDVIENLDPEIGIRISNEIGERNKYDPKTLEDLNNG